MLEAHWVNGVAMEPTYWLDGVRTHIHNTRTEYGVRSDAWVYRRNLYGPFNLIFKKWEWVTRDPLPEKKGRAWSVDAAKRAVERIWSDTFGDYHFMGISNDSYDEIRSEE